MTDDRKADLSAQLRGIAGSTLAGTGEGATCEDAADAIEHLEAVAKAAEWIPQTEKTNRKGNVEVPIEDIRNLKAALRRLREGVPNG